jgi:RNA polymerase sigma-70 factor (ECF subfamily)
LREPRKGTGPANDRGAEFRDLSDEDLMDRCVEGSDQAFRTLVDRYKSRITSLVYRFTHDYQRSEDLAQEVFVRVYLNRTRYRKTGRFSTWIFTIAVNLAKNEIRRLNRLRNFVSLDALSEATGGSDAHFADPGERPDEEVVGSEVTEVVSRAIQKIPVRYRTALILRDIEGMTYEEIGEILSIPGGTVRSRINRARLILKERLKPFMKETK